jgi:hypothetical protein
LALKRKKWKWPQSAFKLTGFDRSKNPLQILFDLKTSVYLSPSTSQHLVAKMLLRRNQDGFQILLTLQLIVVFQHSPTLSVDLHVNQFTAYDCSQPYDIKDVGFAVATNCISNKKIAKETNVTYQVLQRERYRLASGWKCTVDKTQVVLYCGAFDHQTNFAPQTYYNLPLELTIEACREMWTSHVYTDPKGRKHSVLRNTISSIQYDEKGYSYLDGHEVRCIGENYLLPGTHQVVHEAHVAIYLKISLSEESFQYDQDGVTTHTTQVRLACALERQGCATPTTTYGWDEPKDKCELAVTTLSSGVEATNTAEQKVFMSNDGTNIRFILKETMPQCNRYVWETNVPGWYLYSVRNRDLFHRNISKGAMSAVSYGRNKDEYLFNYLANVLQDEFSYILDSDCRRQLELSKLSYWIQHKNPGATTWLIGEDIFGTGNGEVIYQYRCYPVTVVARVTEVCYQALPVERLTPYPQRTKISPTNPMGPLKDKEDLMSPTVEILDDRPLFMEPLTRRLTHQGIEIPCVSRFSAKYRNVNDGWVSHLKTIQGVAAPLLPSDPIERISALDPKIRPQIGSGGVYKQEDIEAMERYMDLPRATTALGTNLVNQAILDQHTRGPINPEDLFPGYQDPRKWMEGLWGKFITFLHEWGEAASILISLYIIIKTGITISGWIYNLFILRDIHGCGRILCWIPFISFFLMKTYRDSPYGLQGKEDRVKRKAQKAQRRRQPRNDPDNPTSEIPRPEVITCAEEEVGLSLPLTLHSLDSDSGCLHEKNQRNEWPSPSSISSLNLD